MLTKDAMLGKPPVPGCDVVKVGFPADVDGILKKGEVPVAADGAVCLELAAKVAVVTSGLPKTLGTDCLPQGSGTGRESSESDRL